MTELTKQDRKRSRYRGKNYEYRVAKKIKGVVVGRSKAVKVGDIHIDVNPQKPPDVINSWLSIECKHLKTLPVWLEKVMAQAVSNAPDGYLVPVAWVGDKESNYVIMREEDFMANFVGENG